MFDLGWSELLVIGVVALIVVGPKDLPVLFRRVGQFVGRARAMAREFSRAMEDAADEAGIKETAQGLKKIADPKKMGLDAVKEATTDFAKWTPDSVTGTTKAGVEKATDKAAEAREAKASEKAEPAKPAKKPATKTAAKTAAKTPSKTAKKPAAKTAAQSAAQTASKTSTKTAARKPAAKSTAAKPAATKTPARKATPKTTPKTTAKPAIPADKSGDKPA